MCMDALALISGMSSEELLEEVAKHDALIVRSGTTVRNGLHPCVEARRSVAHPPSKQVACSGWHWRR